MRRRNGAGRMGDAAAFILYIHIRRASLTQRQRQQQGTGDASAAERKREKAEEMDPAPHPPGRQRSGQLSAMGTGRRRVTGLSKSFAGCARRRLSVAVASSISSACLVLGWNNYTIIYKQLLGTSM